MARRGHAVHLVGIRIDRQLEREPNVKIHRIPIPRFRPTVVRDFWFMMRSGGLIRSRGLADSVIHAHGDVTLARHAVNTCHFVHGTFRAVARELGLGLSAYHSLYHASHARLERRTFRRCAGPLVAVSRKVKRELEALGEPSQRVRVIYHGVEAPRAPSRRDAREAVLREFGLSPSGTVLLFAGELTRDRKGLGTLLEAMALLGPRRDVHLLVAGYAQGSPLVRRAAELGVGDRVTFCGFRRDLPTLMAGADAFVLPTRYDTFGLVILEAQAAGTAVVVSSPDYCGAAELVVDGETGLILRDPRNPVELRDALLRLMDDAGATRRLGETGAALARAFTWDRACEEYESLYAHAEHPPVRAIVPEPGPRRA
jgi:UDP-glucose:(heptosyl)LPS alpha-1,3-glucosyltransferase